MITRIALILLILAGCPALAQDATTLIREGIAFHDKGEYAKAVDMYQRAVAVDPSNGIAYYEMAYSYHLMGDYPNALVASDKAISLSDGQTKLMSMIVKGSVLDDSGDTRGALKVYEQADKMFPGQYLLQFNYGVTLTKVERYKEAEAAFVTALQLNFSHPGSHLQLANLKKRLGHNAMAAMGLYFFLLLENETDRSKEASRGLLALVYPPKDSSNANVISINLSPGGSDKDGSAELFFGMMGVVSDDIDSQTKADRTQQEKFVADTQSYFSVLGELAEKDSKKKKKKKEAAFNIWWDGYVPWLSDIKNAGHTEAFCYHIMKSSGTEEVENWLAVNFTKTDEFFAWIKQRSGN